MSEEGTRTSTIEEYRARRVEEISGLIRSELGSDEIFLLWRRTQDIELILIAIERYVRERPEFSKLASRLIERIGRLVSASRIIETRRA